MDEKSFPVSFKHIYHKAIIVFLFYPSSSILEEEVIIVFPLMLSHLIILACSIFNVTLFVEPVLDSLLQCHKD